MPSKPSFSLFSTIISFEMWYQWQPSEAEEARLVGQLNMIIRLVGEYHILRAVGRLSNANINYQTKCPILLPKSPDLTKLIIRHFHVLTHHVGVSITLSVVRERFWLPCGGTQVKNVIRSCVTCLRQTGQIIKLPERLAFPSYPVNDLRAFSAVWESTSPDISWYETIQRR